MAQTRASSPTLKRTSSDRTAWPLTVDEFCERWKISKDTFYHWRKVKTAPACTRLPNGDLRISREDHEAWLSGLREAV